MSDQYTISNRPLLLLSNEPGITSAVLNRSLSLVKERVLFGDDPCYRDHYGRTYLHLSVYVSSLQLVRYFVEEGVELNEGDKESVTPLHRACRNDDLSMIKNLIEFGANESARADGGIHPLHICARFGYESSAACIIDALKLRAKNRELDFLQDRLVDPTDDNDGTPLQYAAHNDKYEVVELLLRNGACPNAENISNNRPLHFAASKNSKQICKLLIDKGAEIDAQNSSGSTALHIAVESNSISSVIELLKYGPDSNIQDFDGNTSIHLALKRGHTEIVEILVTRCNRCDPTKRDYELNSAFHTALKLGHSNIIPKMLEAPAISDLTVQDSHGKSILMGAIENGAEDLASLMLSACSSLATCATHELVTPLHLAAERGMKRLTQELIVAGASVHAIDANGLTPSLYCAKNDDVLECLALIEGLMVGEGNDDSHRRSSSLGLANEQRLLKQIR